MPKRWSISGAPCARAALLRSAMALSNSLDGHQEALASGSRKTSTLLPEGTTSVACKAGLAAQLWVDRQIGERGFQSFAFGIAGGKWRERHPMHNAFNQIWQHEQNAVRVFEVALGDGLGKRRAQRSAKMLWSLIDRV